MPSLTRPKPLIGHSRRSILPVCFWHNQPVGLCSLRTIYSSLCCSPESSLFFHPSRSLTERRQQAFHNHQLHCKSLLPVHRLSTACPLTTQPSSSITSFSEEFSSNLLAIETTKAHQPRSQRKFTPILLSFALNRPDSGSTCGKIVLSAVPAPSIPLRT